MVIGILVVAKTAGHFIQFGWTLHNNIMVTLRVHQRAAMRAIFEFVLALLGRSVHSLDCVDCFPRWLGEIREIYVFASIFSSVERPSLMQRQIILNIDKLPLLKGLRILVEQIDLGFPLPHLFDYLIVCLE